MIRTTAIAVDRRTGQSHVTDVEVHATVGLPGFYVIGQPDGACRELRDRLRASFATLGFAWPARRITVGVIGGARGVDLAAALSLLIETSQAPPLPAGSIVPAAWLNLDGTIQHQPHRLLLRRMNMPKGHHFTHDEVDSIYVSTQDRFVVSLIVGYQTSDGPQTPEEAARAALELTRGAGSSDTYWYVHDRETGVTVGMEQKQVRRAAFS